MYSNVNIYPRYLIESVYDIGKGLICSDSKDILYNFGVNAIQHDFNTNVLCCGLLCCGVLCCGVQCVM